MLVLLFVNSTCTAIQFLESSIGIVSYCFSCVLDIKKPISFLKISIKINKIQCNLKAEALKSSQT